MIEHTKKNGDVYMMDVEHDFLAVIQPPGEFVTRDVSVEIGSIQGSRTMYMSYKDAKKFVVFMSDVFSKMTDIKNEADKEQA